MTATGIHVVEPGRPRSASAARRQLAGQHARPRQAPRLFDGNLSPLLLQRRRLAKRLHGLALRKIPRMLRRRRRSEQGRQRRTHREQHDAHHTLRAQTLALRQSRSVPRSSNSYRAPVSARLAEQLEQTTTCTPASRGSARARLPRGTCPLASSTSSQRCQNRSTATKP